MRECGLRSVLVAASDPALDFFRISSTDSSRETSAPNIDRGFGDLGRPKKIKIKGVTEAPSEPEQIYMI
jgi:hypothetical protein